jgi:hypothetical protein
MPRNLRLLIVIASLALALVASSSFVTSTAAPTTRRMLTNGCKVSARGVPSCGAYVGGAYGSNSDVRPWERAMGRKLGVHRTYFTASQVDSAVRFATDDARNKRMPWMSFKAPYGWHDMAAGRGDAWATSLAKKMSRVPGPVWVAVHHEPENDSGDLQDWKRMQERLAPIMRRNAPNLGYSVILMGYHQFYGDSKYSLARTWPNTKVDVVGFDIYEKYGVDSWEWKEFAADYFSLIRRWARSKGVAWGLAETGYSNEAARVKPRWPVHKYRLLKRYGGVAFSYFNTPLHSQADFTLRMPAKQQAFTVANSRGVRLR